MNKKKKQSHKKKLPLPSLPSRPPEVVCSSPSLTCNSTSQMHQNSNPATQQTLGDSVGRGGPLVFQYSISLEERSALVALIKPPKRSARVVRSREASRSERARRPSCEWGQRRPWEGGRDPEALSAAKVQFPNASVKWPVQRRVRRRGRHTVLGAPAQSQHR